MGSLHNQTIPRPTGAPLLPFGAEDRGLSFFLGFLVLITIFVPMIPLSRSGRIGLDLILAFMMAERLSICGRCLETSSKCSGAYGRADIGSWIAPNDGRSSFKAGLDAVDASRR